MQELRQVVKDINSRPPQPEDPERSLDPDSEEDPDISVELIDGVFHQLSKDNTLVAITADYPGLIPASQVTEIEVLVPRIGVRPRVFSFSLLQPSFAGEVFEAEGAPPYPRCYNFEAY